MAKEKFLQLTQVPKFQTQRVTLRKFELEDIDRYYQLCSHPELMRPYGLAYHESREKTTKVIQYFQHEFEQKQGVRWAIVHRETNILIGDIGFWRFDWFRERAEMSGKISQSFQRSGLMYEAAQEIISWGFLKLDLNSIEGNILPDNVPSLHFSKKLGFVQEGHLKEFSYSPYEQKYTDRLLFSLHRTRWEERRV